MERLRQAILSVIQEEADTWCAEPEELHEEHRDLVDGFNDCFPDREIILVDEITWHG